MVGLQNIRALVSSTGDEESPRNSSKSGENFAKKGWQGRKPLISLAAQIV
jgi:hypothetical protein